MFCKNCGTELDEKAVVCTKCGIWVAEGSSPYVQPSAPVTPPYAMPSQPMQTYAQAPIAPPYASPVQADAPLPPDSLQKSKKDATFILIGFILNIAYLGLTITALLFNAIRVYASSGNSWAIGYVFPNTYLSMVAYLVAIASLVIGIISLVKTTPYRHMPVLGAMNIRILSIVMFVCSVTAFVIAPMTFIMSLL